MIIIKQNGSSILEHLSNIELYFTPASLINGEEVFLKDDEFHHCVNVMRNSVGDTLFVTDGEGKLYETKIYKINDKDLIGRINKKYEFENRASNIWFCIPLLKNPDRLKFAFEKCVELGITNFILFNSKNSITRKLRPEKYLKTTLSAMKQSLRTYLPKINSASLSEIINLDGTKILFEQLAAKLFDGQINFNEPIYFLFGPEGGFDKKEIEAIDQKNMFNLSSQRLRSETAILKCASLLKF